MPSNQMQGLLSDVWKIQVQVRNNLKHCFNLIKDSMNYQFSVLVGMVLNSSALIPLA